MGDLGQASEFPSGDFTRFWWAETVSSVGTYVTVVALPTLVVLTLDGTAQDVGWLNSARWLPYLLLGLVVGALVDRHRRRPVMVVTDLARAALLVSIPVAWAAGVLSMPLLLLVVACYGAASLVNDAASMSFIPRIVPRPHLQRAHARIDGADAAAQTAGPALAGLLVKLVGAPLAVLVDAATYVFSALTVLTIRGPEPVSVPESTPNVWREIREGVRWVYRGSGLAMLAGATHVWFAANAIVGAVLAPYALTTLGLTPFQFGLAAALAGVGGLLGATTTSAGGRRLGTGGAIITAHAVGTVGVAVMALAGLRTSGWGAAADPRTGAGLPRLRHRLQQLPRDELSPGPHPRWASGSDQHHHALFQPRRRRGRRAARRAARGAGRQPHRPRRRRGHLRRHGRAPGSPRRSGACVLPRPAEPGGVWGGVVRG